MEFVNQDIYCRHLDSTTPHSVYKTFFPPLIEKSTTHTISSISNSTSFPLIATSTRIKNLQPDDNFRVYTSFPCRKPNKVKKDSAEQNYTGGRNKFIIARNLLSQLVRDQGLISRRDVSKTTSLVWMSGSSQFQSYFAYLSILDTSWNEFKSILQRCRTAEAVENIEWKGVLSHNSAFCSYTKDKVALFKRETPNVSFKVVRRKFDITKPKLRKKSKRINQDFLSNSCINFIEDIYK
ncbi:MATa2 protein [[Candida] anglica]